VSSDSSPLAGIWSETAGVGHDQAIVLVHGSMDRSAGLLRLSRRLSDQFEVIRYDRRGYGRSSGIGPPFTVADHVTDLVQVIERHLDGAAALVFGHSFGGNVALAAAQRRPELVDRVCIYEPPLSWLGWWPSGTAGATALSQPDVAEAAEAFMRRLVGDAKWERLPSATRSARRAEGPAMVGELADLRVGPPWDPALITQPVLALFGERAQPHHQRAMRAIGELLPHARAEMITGAGHVGPNTHADLVSAAITGFIASSAE
jgi:pimeloyl-ACP methyl ester carboxylesterase